MLFGINPMIMGSGFGVGPRVVAYQTYHSSATNSAPAITQPVPSEARVGDVVIAIAFANGANPTFAATPRFIVSPEGWAPIAPGTNVARNSPDSNGSNVGELAYSITIRPYQAGEGSWTFTPARSRKFSLTYIVLRNAGIPATGFSWNTTRSSGVNVGNVVINSGMVPALLLGVAGHSTSGTTAITDQTFNTELDEVFRSYNNLTNNETPIWSYAGTKIFPEASSTGLQSYVGNGNRKAAFSLIFSEGSTIPWRHGKHFAPGGSGSFVVPEGVTSINIVCIGPGAPGQFTNQGPYPGASGASAYSNNVAVTPGETLTTFVGSRVTTTFNPNKASHRTYVMRGSTVLVRADCAVPASPTTAPGFLNPSIPGQAGECIGQVVSGGGGGFGNTGGSIFTFGAGVFTTTEPSSGNGYTSSFDNMYFSRGVGGFGTGGATTSQGSLVGGGGGLILITWGYNRGFGGVSGGFGFV